MKKSKAEGLKADRSNKRKPGRPTAFKPEFVKQAEKLSKLGATDMQLADFFEVTVATLNNWKLRYPQFFASLKTAKAEADKSVERSLFNRAVGYSFDAVKIMQDKGKPVMVPFREHVPPDPTSCIFWLKNRQPQAWRDKMEHEHGGTIKTVRVDAPILG